MPKPPRPKPTDAELDILRVLWQLGPATVRDVHDQLARTRDVGYTTILKLLQIMHEKGLVHRDETERTHVYRPALDRETTQSQLIRDLIDRAFDGSAHALLLRAIDTKRASRKEIEEIRQLLDELEGNSR